MTLLRFGRVLRGLTSPDEEGSHVAPAHSRLGHTSGDALIGQGRPEPLQRRGDSAKRGGHPARGRSHASSSRSGGSCALAPCRE